MSLYLVSRLIRLVGEGGVHIATRVMSIVTAALVQYVLNGITGCYNLLSSGKANGPELDWLRAGSITKFQFRRTLIYTVAAISAEVTTARVFNWP